MSSGAVVQLDVEVAFDMGYEVEYESSRSSSVHSLELVPGRDHADDELTDSPVICL